MKFRKKPVVIEAVQWNGSNTKEVEDFARDSARVFKAVYPSDNPKTVPYIDIYTLEGTMRASVGDYIIKGVNGEFYPCKPDIFEKTYEPAE